MSIEVETLEEKEHPYQEYELYRSVSISAVAVLVLALLSLSSFLYVPLLMIPAVGAFLGLYSIANLRRHRDRLTGMSLAMVGTTLSALMLIGGGAMHWVIYITEVPEGHLRIAYYLLQPDDDETPNEVPEKALQYDGQKIFIKGYVYPGAQIRGIRQFLLVGDRGDCCFGGDPKLTDRIQVTLSGDDALNYSQRLIKVAGTFRIEELQKAIDGPGGVFYHLEEAQLR